MNQLDGKIIDTIRVISAEGVEKANSGHPGICLGAAPIGYALFDGAMRYNPKNPDFFNRDRFVLSAGHGSMLLYTLLHLYGYDVTKDDLMRFRQYGSLTPGHPEYRHTPGVEITTGPLGQGIANAVGMAIAEAALAARFNRKGFDLVDHRTFVLMGDGCNMEGICYEAASLAGTLKLGKLVALYDSNAITIEGSTDIAFTEDVAARYKAMGWRVLTVSDVEDVDDLREKIATACRRSDKPTLIVCKSVIGYGSPDCGTAKVHGSPLGKSGVQYLREKLGYDVPPFEVSEEIKPHLAEIAAKGQKYEASWNKLFTEYSEKYPDLAKQFMAAVSGDVSAVSAALDALTFPDKEATRSSGGKALNAISAVLPSLFGGSADLAPSNKTALKDRTDFSADNRLGSNVHFGVREHAMAAICNGIAAHGGLRTFCSTFFVFGDYMKNAVRLSALMKLPVAYVLTHDSIGVGEDGPTHQPVEQLVGMRSIPGLDVWRPADSRETVAAYKAAFTGSLPTALVLSRQDLPKLTAVGDPSKGGYIIFDCGKIPDVILLASGSEVSLALSAAAILSQKGVAARVVSMPCMEVFDRQSEDYKQSVLPPSVRARVAVEAGSAYSWHKYCGLDGETVTMDVFGASAPAETLFEKFGFTAENVVEKALLAIKNSAKRA